MTYYKVVKDGRSCNGGSFDFTEYLPGGKKSGRWTPVIKNLNLCSSGYHITEYWNMWYETGCSVYEIEAKDVSEDYNVGVIDKWVCSSIRFVKKLDLVFDGKENTGDRNTGDRNTGNWNTGDRNTGDRNTGNWNTGEHHSGAFNTKKPEKTYLFDKEILYSEYEKISFPSWFCFEILSDDRTLHKSWKKSFKTATKKDLEKTILLPNFCYKVFEEITGVSKKMIEKRLKE